MEIRTHGNTHFSEGVLSAHVRSLNGYKSILSEALADETYTSHEAVLRTPFDANLAHNIQAQCKPYRDKTRLVVLVGIGGSNLGTCAIYDALRGYKRTFFEESTPKLVSFGTVEPDILKEAKSLFSSIQDPEEIILVVVSKSGTTLESTTNANILFSLFEERFGRDAVRAQTIIIADADTELARKSEQEGILFFSLPKMIGGRYSVFTAVGLVPLYILGFDIDAFMLGGQRASLSSATQGAPSSAATMASFLYDAYLEGARVHELFMWHPELVTVGAWYRQLLAESIGKAQQDGTKVGYTPTIAVGSTDLHSVGQLIFGGRNDRFTTFVRTARNPSASYPPHVANTLFSLSELDGKNVYDVFKALFEGVENAYKKSDLSFSTIELAKIDERELGAFMALHMATVMYLAHLFGINAFDQPSVETYKKEVRVQLTSNSTE